jgi:diacylglycerol kinase family enzyme
VRRLALQVVTLPRESPEPALRFFAHIPGLRVLVMGGDGTVGWILKAIMEDLVPAVQQVGGEGCIMLCC